MRVKVDVLLDISLQEPYIFFALCRSHLWKFFSHALEKPEVFDVNGRKVIFTGDFDSAELADAN